MATSGKTIQRTGGPFWQDCTGGCGDKAEANRTPAGKPILCQFCARQQGVELLPRPTQVEKQRLLKSIHTASKPTPKRRAVKRSKKAA